MNRDLFVITSYPEKGTIHAEKTVGGASYTKLILTALKKQNPGQSITVLAEKLVDSESSLGPELRPREIMNHESRIKQYRENGIIVKRVWQQNKLSSLISLIPLLIREKNASVMLSYEAYMFGNPFLSLIPLLSLMVLRLTTGQRIYVIMHQVVSDFHVLSPGIRGTLMNVAIKALYKLISLAATKRIVFEEELKKRLGNDENIIVIPHAVANVKSIPVKRARQKLALSESNTYVLCFGYLAPYKGLESLVALWPKEKSLGTPKLILAGGINPNHKTNKTVVTYVKNLLAQIKENPNIHATGYVAESDIPFYFSAADAVIIPYKTFLSSSGPLSLALAYHKPVLFAEELSGYAKTKDIAKALKNANLSMNDLVFKRTTAQLVKSFTLKTEKAVVFAKEIAKLRSEREIAKLYGELINEANTNPVMLN